MPKNQCLGTRTLATGLRATSADASGSRRSADNNRAVAQLFSWESTYGTSSPPSSSATKIGGSYWEIPGANGQGRTKDEARQSLAEAIALILEVRREDGLREFRPRRCAKRLSE